MIDLIKSKFPAAVRDTIEFRGETTLVIEPEALIAVATFLRDEPSLGFDLLSDVSAVDHYPAQPRFAVNYQVYALDNALSLRLKVWLDGETPSIASLTGVYPGANWHEREVWDLMGIRFDGRVGGLKALVMGTERHASRAGPVPSEATTAQPRLWCMPSTHERRTPAASNI